MMNFLKALLYGIVEGITEWLPISSTGHMILLNEFLKMDVSEEFWNMFLVVIQLGAIMAVVVLYIDRLWPFGLRKKKKKGLSPVVVKTDILRLWGKIIVACLPAAVIGILFDDLFDSLFYNAVSVSIALIVFGIGFIVIENYNRGRRPRINSVEEIDMKTALIIGGFQVLAAVFPGTSRSGATILGALLIGVSRKAAAEFTFFLAVPVMAGASLLKIVKYIVDGGAFGGAEIGIVLTGFAVAFVVSMVVIKFFMGYIRKHDFKVFGWYRIALGVVVLAFFGIRMLINR